MKNDLCVKLVIYKDYTEMHAQQNIKISKSYLWKYHEYHLISGRL
jgi:hypothetical protein